MKTVTVRLRYGSEEMILPMNPENIQVNRSSSSKTTHIVGLGEISIPQSPSLATVKISSAFYHQLIGQTGFISTKQYADWFKRWQRLKQPARWTVDELGYDLQVVCESFDYDVRAGEENDVYFDLSLKEYRPYGAKILTVNQETKTAAPVAEPRTSSKPPVTQSYTAVAGDSLWAIAKKLSGSGDNWSELYQVNKSVVGNNPNLIYAGQIFAIPQGWVTA